MQEWLAETHEGDGAGTLAGSVALNLSQPVDDRLDRRPTP